MRKQYIYLLGLLALGIFVFVGCSEEPVSDVEPPSNLAVEATANGLGLTLNWSASPTESDANDPIDYYYIYFDGDSVGAVEAGVHSFQYEFDGLGTISVRAYRESDDALSSAVSISTDLITHDGITLGGWETTNPSGIGFDRATGGYDLYSATEEYKDVIDVVWDSRDNTLNSPSAFWTTDDVYFCQLPSDGIVPDTGLRTQITIAINVWYAVDMDNANYFAKMRIISIDGDGNATVEYGFQLIEGYRVLE